MRVVKPMWLLLFSLHLLAPPAHAQDQQTVLPTEALKYHLQVKAVCGKIVGTQYAKRIPGQPTLLHMGKPYPEQTFTIVIWERDRGSFSKSPEELYKNREVCVTGLIVEHNGKPQIVVKSPYQVSVRQAE